MKNIIISQEYKKSPIHAAIIRVQEHQNQYCTDLEWLLLFTLFLGGHVAPMPLMIDLAANPVDPRGSFSRGGVRRWIYPINLMTANS